MRSRVMTGKLLLANALAVGLSCGAYAQTPDADSAVVRSNPKDVNVAARDSTRRQIFERLFTARGIRVDWVDESLAEEVMPGSFEGPTDRILRSVLAQTNFIIVYQSPYGEPRLSRIIILGRASATQTAPDTRAIEAALAPAAPPAPVIPPNTAPFRRPR
jgi:hypothetical protein